MGAYKVPTSGPLDVCRLPDGEAVRALLHAMDARDPDGRLAPVPRSGALAVLISAVVEPGVNDGPDWAGLAQALWPGWQPAGPQPWKRIADRASAWGAAQGGRGVQS